MANNQPVLQFSVMCLDLLEDEKKPPTLQYLFYELPFPQIPFRMDRFHVINCWSNGTGEYKQAIKILTPDRSKVFIETGEQQFSLEEAHTPQLMINVFADLEFTQPGHYWVQNFLNERCVLEYPLTVRLLEGGARPTTAPPAPERKPEPSPRKEEAKKGIGFPEDEWFMPR